ncbi:MAG: right-handed parallel beta-helix repeat-containing protein [Paludibacteraceae bacterium]|nr:right-handed parallel beta-helix repeat-containing protein [Paludibacteraceae bacterium]
MKKLFFVATALLCGAISANAVDYLVQTGSGGSDVKWSQEAINALLTDNANLKVISFDTAGVAKLPKTGEIWFAAGTYTFSATYNFGNDAKLYGGFAGTETILNERVLVSVDKPYEFKNATIFDGGKSVKLLTDSKTGMVLNGLTVQNSKGVRGVSAAGVCRLAPGATVKACQFLNCSHDTIVGTDEKIKAGQGGVFNLWISSQSTAAVTTIENCYFEGNSTTYQGGAIYINYPANATTEVRHCVFVGNTAETTGAAIHGQGASPYYIDGCVFYNNVCKSGETLKAGGVLYDNGSNISNITNCLAYNNTGLNVFYLKLGKFANNTIVKNIGQTYVATGNASSEISNNVIWGNTNASGVATSLWGNSSNNATKNVICKNNFHLQSVSSLTTTLGWTVTDNVLFNTNTVNETKTETVDEKDTTYVGPYFVKPTSFVGAIAADATDKESKLEELEAADWSLQAKSMLINAGTDLTYVTTDILGTAREAGKYDVGAYAYVDKGPGTAFENTEKAPLDIQAALQVGEVFNILGQRVGDLQAGNIYIVGGQKVLMR